MKGKVRWFDAVRAFGFIYSEELGGDIFIHASHIVPSEGGIKTLHQGDAVEFETYQKENKGLRAKNVKVIQEENGHDNGKEVL